ncbi:MAG: hypothetical protein M3335_01825 [Actinomycetota bacterium]|nr:hypothetical protein [Actinomycetota bacterium]
MNTLKETGKTSNQGGASTTIEGSINGLSFTSCNGTVHVLKKGKMIIHYTSGSNGTVTSEGWEVTVAIGSTSCTYDTPSATYWGTISGGSPAILKGEALMAKVAGGFLCAAPAPTTRNETITTPNP